MPTFLQKQYNDFARTQVTTADDLNNTTNPITIDVDDGSVFATITTGQRVVISSTTDPMNDTSREKAEITARSGNSITLSRPNAVAHTGNPYVFNALLAVDMEEVKVAIDAVDSALTVGLASAAKASYNAIVAPTGGDYTTVVGALTALQLAGITEPNILVVGTVTETDKLELNTSPFNTFTKVGIFGTNRQTSRIILPNDTAKLWNLQKNGSFYQGVSFVGGDKNLPSNDTSWIRIAGQNVFVENCGFEAQGSTTTTTGCLVGLGGSSGAFYRPGVFRNNFFTNNNAGAALISLQSYGMSVVEISGNILYGTQKMGFIKNSSAYSGGGVVDISGNKGYVVSGSSGAFIEFIKSSIWDKLTIKSNVFIIGTLSSSMFIQVIGDGNSQSALIKDNMCTGSSGSLATSFDIKVQTLGNLEISGNMSRKIGAGFSNNMKIINNNVYDLIDTAGYSTSSGMIVSGNHAGRISIKGDNCIITDNKITTTSLDVSGSNNFIVSGNKVQTNLIGSTTTYSTFSGNVVQGEMTVTGTSSTCKGNSITGNRVKTLTISGDSLAVTGNTFQTFNNTTGGASEVANNVTIA